MSNLRWNLRVAIALAAAHMVVAGCAPIEVRSYVERGADLTSYRTYDWESSEVPRTGDPRLDNNPFFDEHVRAEVDRQLGMRGFERRSSTPALLVHYHASITQDIDVGAVDRRYGVCEECEPSVYDAGTLVIDLIDASSKQIVWRGWAEGRLDGAIDHQSLLEQRIEEAVRRIIQTLPQRSRAFGDHISSRPLAESR